MGEVVNLRRARKARDRAVKIAEAASNRALHGRTKVARETEETSRVRAERSLDGHRREDQKE